jgi:hypothetical protein
MISSLAAMPSRQKIEISHFFLKSPSPDRHILIGIMLDALNGYSVERFPDSRFS